MIALGAGGGVLHCVCVCDVACRLTVRYAICGDFYVISRFIDFVAYTFVELSSVDVDVSPQAEARGSPLSYSKTRPYE